MIEGADALDFTRAPAEQLPVSGLVPGESLTLVRNPAWKETLDPLRPALADRIEFFAVPTSAEGVTALLEGRAELFVVTPFGYVPPDAADQIRASGGLARLHVNQSDFISQILINTAQPPFDDLHVRRAANYIVNKARLVELVTMGFPIRPAHHLVPDAMEDNLLVDYRPYASPGDAGDLEAAKREMALSTYDSNGDGLCDAPECVGVTILSRDRPAGIGQSVREDLAQIGIEGTLDIRDTEEFFDIFADPTRHVGVYASLAWAKDVMSPAGFFLGQFYGPESFGDLSGNGALVGATPEDLREWGYGDVEVPNVDQRIEACLPLTGAASFECWAGLDQYMMENVVPSIPFGLGLGTIGASSGVEFVWDQLATAPSYDSIAVNP